MGNIVNRTKNMILQPKATWEVIKTEDTWAAMVLTGYLFPLTFIIGALLTTFGLASYQSANFFQ